MSYRSMRMALAAMMMLGSSWAAAADAPDAAQIDKAFEALKSYDWGQDRNTLKAIDAAAVAPVAARGDLEKRLAGVLEGGASRAAKDYACRKLRQIGTAATVPALARLLTDKELSHMARFALETNEAPEAAQALRDSLAKTGGETKIGVIVSLGARRDAASVAPLAALATDSDKAIAKAAIVSLGNIGTAEAAKVLGDIAGRAPQDAKAAVADARLNCAEKLLAGGKRVEAMAVYKALSGEDQPKEVRLAATRGLLTAASAKP